MRRWSIDRGCKHSVNIMPVTEYNLAMQFRLLFNLGTNVCDLELICFFTCCASGRPLCHNSVEVLHTQIIHTGTPRKLLMHFSVTIVFVKGKDCPNLKR